MKSCPLCRGERAYAETSKILGLDELLVSVRELLHTPEPPRDET